MAPLHRSLPILLLSILFLLHSGCNPIEKDVPEYVQIPNSPETLPFDYDNQSDSILFRLVDPGLSGIRFSNEVRETFDRTFWRFKFQFTGSGIGVGDFNNDGLQDLFLVSNFKSDGLYINEGELKFRDISATSGIVDSTGYSFGVAVADFNYDGWLDIYVTKAGGKIIPEELRRNRLYINNRDLTFTERAAEFGLDDPSNSTQASLMDYDRDGDLDLYLTNHWLRDKSLSSLKTLAHIEKGTNFSDVFYRNNGDGTFTDISREAGINNNGMGWSGTVADFNNDGWPDIYVANDFIMYNYLYMNTGEGSFKQSAFESLDKMTKFGMGSDVGDINNDGHMEVIVAGIDMREHEAQKNMLDFSDTKAFEAALAGGYHYQKERNTLQLNNGDGTFSEIGAFAGVHSTNWSWATLLEDLDNDGWSDLFIANGFYIPWYMDNRFSMYGKLRTAIRTGDEKSYFDIRGNMYRDHHNYPNEIFRNNGDLTFTRKTEEWGGKKSSVSYGAAVADFDNDGDLDIISSNTNHPPTFYENRSRQLKSDNYLTLQIRGSGQNPFALGTRVFLYDREGKILQHKHVQPIRGYLSTSDYRIHFGLGELTNIPSMRIVWPDGKETTLRDIPVNRILQIDPGSAIPALPKPASSGNPLFTRLPNDVLPFVHRENVYDDMDRQFSIHYKQSMHGPAIATGDINGDLLDDVYFGGALGHPAQLFVQNDDGTFRAKEVDAFVIDRAYEDMGCLFFDADSDGDLDLYQVSGGGEFRDDPKAFQDRLYINDGKGNFERSDNALPEITGSGSCVVASDYDRDGDLDLFVGGRVTPSFYPRTPRSYLLQNNGGKFADITPDNISKVGMVTSAVWSDFNNDNARDLILVGDWMPIKFFENQNGVLVDVSGTADMERSEGWWNSISAADLDSDGDMDYVLGNAGLNTAVKTSPEEPLAIVYGELDSDDREDQIYTYYNGGIRYPLYGFGTFQQQFPEWKKHIPGFSAFAKLTFEDLKTRFFPERGEEVRVRRFENIWIENLGNGTFIRHELPVLAQLSPIHGLVTGDFDGDTHIDILCHGNFYGAHYAFERQDAGTGLFLKGDGEGGFTVSRGAQCGFLSDGDARSLALVSSKDGSPLVIAASNSEEARVFRIRKGYRSHSFHQNDEYAMIRYPDGRIQKIENHIGNGYLSQSSQIFLTGDGDFQLQIHETSGNERHVLAHMAH